MIELASYRFASHLSTESFTFAFVRINRNFDAVVRSLDMSNDCFHRYREYLGEILVISRYKYHAGYEYNYEPSDHNERQTKKKKRFERILYQIF